MTQKEIGNIRTIPTTLRPGSIAPKLEGPMDAPMLTQVQRLEAGMRMIRSGDRSRFHEVVELAEEVLKTNQNNPKTLTAAYRAISDDVVEKLTRTTGTMRDGHGDIKRTETRIVDDDTRKMDGLKAGYTMRITELLEQTVDENARLKSEITDLQGQLHTRTNGSHGGFGLG